MLYDIMRDIMDNLTCIRIVIFVFPCYCILQNEYCDAKFVYGILSKHLDELRETREESSYRYTTIDMNFCFARTQGIRELA